MELIEPSSIQGLLATKFAIETVKHMGLIGSDFWSSKLRGFHDNTKGDSIQNDRYFKNADPHPTGGVRLKMGV